MPIGRDKPTSGALTAIADGKRQAASAIFVFVNSIGATMDKIDCIANTAFMAAVVALILWGLVLPRVL